MAEQLFLRSHQSPASAPGAFSGPRQLVHPQHSSARHGLEVSPSGWAGWCLSVQGGSACI